MNLDNLKRFESETVITEEYAVEVYRSGRGCFATVKDEGSRFNGTSAFACMPATAFAMLLDKVAELKQMQAA
jgi:hypothetical protein